MPDAPIILSLTVSSDIPVSQEDLHEETLALRDELLELKVQSVELETRETPEPGTKAGDVFSWGALVIAVAPEMIKQLIKFIVDWLPRDSTRIIKIRRGSDGSEYELKGEWKADQLARIMAALAKEERANV